MIISGTSEEPYLILSESSQGVFTELSRSCKEGQSENVICGQGEGKKWKQGSGAQALVLSAHLSPGPPSLAWSRRDLQQLFFGLLP